MFLNIGLFGVGFASSQLPNLFSSTLKGSASAPKAAEAFSSESAPFIPVRHAISIRQYEIEIRQAIQAGRPLDENIRYIHGLNQIDGFLIEPDEEVILFGRHDPLIPPLQLDDLVVALRNAYQVEDFQGVLGVTIDPTPGAADPWLVQSAKILGMPHTTRMGARQLAIDYELKRVSAGLHRLPQKSVEVQGTFDALSFAGDQPGERPAASSSTHRFWFTALVDDGPRYSEDDQGLWIDKAVNVRLLSEEEFLNNGERVGGAPPQPQAKIFAESITKVLSTDEVPQYVMLRNDFRLIEVAKLIRFKQVRETALLYFLQESPLSIVDIPHQVRGVRRTDSSDATWDMRLDLNAENRVINRKSSQSYRGGVEVDIPIEPIAFVSEAQSRLEEIRQRIRKSRPSGDTVTWEIGA
jgi:hypothetical protein